MVSGINLAVTKRYSLLLISLSPDVETRTYYIFQGMSWARTLSYFVRRFSRGVYYQQALTGAARQTRQLCSQIFANTKMSILKLLISKLAKWSIVLQSNLYHTLSISWLILSHNQARKW